MKIQLENVPKKVRRYRVQRAIEFFAEALMAKDLHEEISVMVKFVPLKELNAFGDCIWLDDNYKGREFEIRVWEGSSKHRILSTLAHEMVHVRQYALGLLYDYIKTDDVRWRGRRYTNPAGTCLEEYHKLPWEMEALAYEKPLMAGYKVKYELKETELL